MPTLHPSRTNPNAASQESIPDSPWRAGAWEHLGQATPGRFHSEASPGVGLELPSGHRWQGPGGSLGPDLEEMQRECCGNARYEQCKEAMNLDRKIRKGFPEEGLREKGD